MKVLVTGAAGMVGTHLVRRLSRDVAWQVLTPSVRDLDLLDQDAVASYLNDNRPDWIIHLAAKVGGIQANMNEPVEFLAENILMSTQLIYSACKLGVKNFLNIGSSCMYPKDREILREEDLLTGPLEPTNEGYAIAKISSTVLCQAIHQQYGLNYKTIVPCNLYGPHDNFNPIRSHLIPAVIRKIHEAKMSGRQEIEIWGSGKARREFMYVDDLVDFILLALAKIESIPDMVNVGLGDDLSIDDYYDAASLAVGYKGRFIHDLNKPEGMKKKMMDVSKARQLGWKASISLMEGLKKTYEYFLSIQ